MKKTVVFIFIGIVMFFGSCKSKKQVADGERATSGTHLVMLIQQTQPTFTTMNANNIEVNVDMNGQKYNSPASLKMITDSVIVLAAYPFLGIEMFSLELYPERWILYDKMNRKYVTDNYEYFSLRYGTDIDFNSFQSIFSARLFNIGQKDIDIKKYNFIPAQGGKNEIVYENAQIKQTTHISNINTIENVMLKSKNNSYLLNIAYNNYSITKGVNYPRNILMKAVMDNTADINLKMNIQKVNFNSDVKISFSNPERYERTTIDQIFTK